MDGFVGVGIISATRGRMTKGGEAAQVCATGKKEIHVHLHGENKTSNGNRTVFMCVRNFYNI